MIFQGIRTSIAKKPYSFVICQGGGGAVTPCTPSGYVHVIINDSYLFFKHFRNESPYDNANGFQPVGFNYAPEPQDNGYTNPMYVGRAAANQEPMPEQSDIGITHEDVVLTTDSWQKEQLKGPDA